tara:strand:- start:2111 stop:2308 length:198 start_codon:yes stop_codon:yes gene_type:complete
MLIIEKIMLPKRITKNKTGLEMLRKLDRIKINTRLMRLGKKKNKFIAVCLDTECCNTFGKPCNMI